MVLQSKIERGCSALLSNVRVCLFDPPEDCVRRVFKAKNSDGYVVGWLVLLVAVSFALWFRSSLWILLMGAAFLIYRLCDLLSHHLHSMLVKVRASKSPVRDVEIAFMNFVQVALGFGVMFYVLEYFCSNSFHVSEGQTFTIGNEVYLALVTLTTLGASDIYPLGKIAKILTSLAVLVSIILLTFIVTRHMASYIRWQEEVNRSHGAEDKGA